MKNIPPLDIGNRGEKLAAEYLKKHKYKILARNFRSRRWGEIDLVALDGDTLVFVEVKSRRSTQYGSPSDAITKYKLEALKRAGHYYKMVHPNTPEKLRIDFVEVIFTPSRAHLEKIDLIKNVPLED